MRRHQREDGGPPGLPSEDASGFLDRRAGPAWSLLAGKHPAVRPLAPLRPIPPADPPPHRGSHPLTPSLLAAPWWREGWARSSSRLGVLPSCGSPQPCGNGPLGALSRKRAALTGPCLLAPPSEAPSCLPAWSLQAGVQLSPVASTPGTVPHRPRVSRASRRPPPRGRVWAQHSGRSTSAGPPAPRASLPRPTCPPALERGQAQATGRFPGLSQDTQQVWKLTSYVRTVSRPCFHLRGLRQTSDHRGLPRVTCEQRGQQVPGEAAAAAPGVASAGPQGTELRAQHQGTK